MLIAKLCIVSAEQYKILSHCLLNQKICRDSAEQGAYNPRKTERGSGFRRIMMADRLTASTLRGLLN
ncbi:MAG: hypothetical protein ACRESZ_20535 [Methylococcales bacterium]